MAKHCFFTFHYRPDCHRAAQVRKIGAIEGNRVAIDNEWETVRGKDDASIEKWIARQMKGKTCNVVLVGKDTANRKWINYEIIKSWRDGLGVVGIYIYGLRNLDGDTSSQGKNPFDCFTVGSKDMSSLVKCYRPGGATSKERYAWIQEHLSNAIAEAIEIRKPN